MTDSIADRVIALAHDIAGQQAMTDDWWVPVTRALADEVVALELRAAKLESALVCANNSCARRGARIVTPGSGAFAEFSP